MKLLIAAHRLYEYLFDRWTVSVEEYPYENKKVIYRVNKFNGKKGKVTVKPLR